MKARTRPGATLSRRGFLLGIAASGAVVALGPLAARAADGPFSPNVWMRLDPDGTVHLTCNRSEMGQGTRSSIPALLAKELGASLDRVQVAQAQGHPKYGNQNTDGSRSIRNQYTMLRRMAAVGRTVLEQVGAKRLGVPADAVEARDHAIVHRPSGRTIAFGDLAGEAARAPLPDPEKVTLRADIPAEGWALPLVDAKGLVTGAAQFGADVRLDGMCVAVIRRPPVLGSTVERVDATAAKAMKGVIAVVEMPKPSGAPGFQPLGGVAVVAEDTWIAQKAAKALRINWSKSPHDAASWATDLAAMRAAVATPGTPRRVVGEAGPALARAAQRITATYVVPYLAHAALEPPVAIARRTAAGCEIWTSVQTPQRARTLVAERLGIAPDAVQVNVTLLGAGFGRKSKPDYVVEAAVLADRTKRPVRVQWLREDALAQGYIHACSVQTLEAGLTADGAVDAWRHRIASPTIGSTFGPARELRDSELGQGLADLPLAIPHLAIETHPVEQRMRIGWLRSVYNINHAFAVQCFLDEIAHARKVPLPDLVKEVFGPPRQLTEAEAKIKISNYGASLAEHPIDVARYHRVIDRVRARSKFDAPAPAGRARGFAVHRSFLTYVAVVVEVSKLPDGRPRVEQAWVVADAGRIVNQERVRAQLEGAVIFGASLALHSRLDYANGRITTDNFQGYRVLRMHEAPRAIDVEVITEGEAPGGIGEPGVPPVAPAIANAWFALTGERARELPITARTS